MNPEKATFCLLYIINLTHLSLNLTANYIKSTHIHPPSLLLSSLYDPLPPLHLRAHCVNSDESLHAYISDSRGHTVLLLPQYKKQARSQQIVFIKLNVCECARGFWETWPERRCCTVAEFLFQGTMKWLTQECEACLEYKATPEACVVFPQSVWPTNTTHQGLTCLKIWQEIFMNEQILMKYMWMVIMVQGLYKIMM